jgi:hypothetical protein
MLFPSGEDAALYTMSVWPVSGSPIGLPFVAFRSRKVWSAEVDTMRFPSGEKAALDTSAWWP